MGCYILQFDARFVAHPPFIDSFRQGLWSVSISGCQARWGSVL